MTFTLAHTPDAITLTLVAQKRGLLDRLRAKPGTDLTHLAPQDRKLALALADLRSAAAETGEPLTIESDTIRLSHRLAAALDGTTGAELGLPPLTDLVLHTNVEGVVGEPSFRLHTEWRRNGQRKLPARTGALLQSDRGSQRVPLWMLDALELAESYRSGQGDAADWEALARFRRALDPGIVDSGDSQAARFSMTDFLSGLEVRLADRFSITPDAQGTDFEVVPFSGHAIGEAPEVTESMAELAGASLGDFQRKLRQRGALNAFRLGPGKFLVIDRAAAPVLEVMTRMQRAPREERREFIRNPRPRITEALEAALEARGALAGLDDAGREESIEAAAGPAFVETSEYEAFSARVTGIEIYERPDLSLVESSGTTWLPELFSAEVRSRLEALPNEALAQLGERLRQAIDTGQEHVTQGDLQLPAHPEVLQAVELRLKERSAPPQEEPEDDDTAPEDLPSGPVVLRTEDNFEEVHWRPATPPRTAAAPLRLPRTITTPLKDHQVESFDWQVKAWQAGLPGVLNADEQGLGKTLQTISFLVWLNEHMKHEGTKRGPILVVAPTSLLVNWEQEVARHVASPGLGHLIRLYGSGIGNRKKAATQGRDIESGASKLDFSDLERAAEVGAGHLTWILTTYSTLTNYQHSLARIPFSAAVFDEIQAIKNPTTLSAVAARAMKADFRIGLTGTPIENSTVDLWAIMDQLAPGALGSLKDFRQRYALPDTDNMADLHARVFKPQGDLPPLGLRRIKDTVARDLPSKTRLLAPRTMPRFQAETYDQARIQLAAGAKGAALKLLHHIRTVSVHPALHDAAGDEDFIAASARLNATFDLLRDIRAAGQRALVFIEHRQMQYRFIELARAEFGLDRIDLINGNTAIKQRQEIVNRFQRHLEHDEGFDLLVLGPKAAGTGLTLTAATHVIHLSRWWNPAVEEQCNDRVHRIGQTRPVTIHVPMAIHPGYRAQSFDCLLQSLMQRKRHLASSALWPMGDTGSDAGELQRLVAQETSFASGGDPVDEAMAETFARDGTPCPPPDAKGEYRFE